MSSTGGGGAGGSGGGGFFGAAAWLAAAFDGLELPAFFGTAGFAAAGLVAEGLPVLAFAALTGDAHSAAQAAARDRARIDEASMGRDSTRAMPATHNLPVRSAFRRPGPGRRGVSPAPRLPRE